MTAAELRVLLEAREDELDRQRDEIAHLEAELAGLRGPWVDPMGEAAMGVVVALACQHGVLERKKAA